MDRMTARDRDGIAFLRISLNENRLLDVGPCYTGIVAERFAKYEDTGLTPEEVVKLRDGAPVDVKFDIGDKGFVSAVNTAFKKKYGKTPDELIVELTHAEVRAKELELALSQAGRTIEATRKLKELVEADNTLLTQVFSAEGVAHALYAAYANPSRFGYDTPSPEWNELLEARCFNFTQTHPGTALLERLQQTEKALGAIEDMAKNPDNRKPMTHLQQCSFLDSIYDIVQQAKEAAHESI